MLLAIASTGAMAVELEFHDAAAPRCNQLPLGAPARLAARLDGGRLIVDILANFGCGTTAGDARADSDGATLTLSARTLLPDYPTPQCLCTRELVFSLPWPQAAAVRIRYKQDSRPAVGLEARE